MLQDSVTAVGGVRIGWVNASWPFARLTVDSDQLDLKTTLLGRYTFTPDQVVGIEKHGGIPFLGWGIRIHHNIPTYPRKIVFWCMGSPRALMERIVNTGFVPCADPLSMPEGRGLAVRWQALVGIIVLWNILFMIDWVVSAGAKNEPGFFVFLAVFLLFAGSVALWRVETLQRIIMKPGRGPDEIKAWLYLSSFVSGVLTLFFIMFFIFGAPA